MSRLAFEDAQRLVLEHAQPLPVEPAPLQAVHKRFLAEPVRTPFAVPRFDNTAVDGYAVRIADVESASVESPVKLSVAGAVRGGDVVTREILGGEALRVFTGAPLPASAQAVVMQEDTALLNGHVFIRRNVAPGENIRREGEEFPAGAQVLETGVQITPPVIGLLASLGFASVAVHAKPKVAVIVTGNELVSPGAPLREGQICDANSAGLSAALRVLPVDFVYLAQTADDLAAVERDVAFALAQSDVVVTVGGASVGEYDYVKDAFRHSGANLHFTSVAIKPGKPTVFATFQDGERKKLMFGLPGNPVSALVAFHLFVRPALRKLLGARQCQALRWSASLGSRLTKQPGRAEFVRARLVFENRQWAAYPTIGQQSHMLGGLTTADALIHVPADATELLPGSVVDVERLEW